MHGHTTGRKCRLGRGGEGGMRNGLQGRGFSRRRVVRHSSHHKNGCTQFYFLAFSAGRATDLRYIVVLFRSAWTPGIAVFCLSCRVRMHACTCQEGPQIYRVKRVRSFLLKSILEERGPSPTHGRHARHLVHVWMGTTATNGIVAWRHSQTKTGVLHKIMEPHIYLCT